ncbi:hypothetical protein ABGB18_31385 [Nonomuraea sp. B12E4]|uniref:hypothetical protein n=1 Tax=Nonomuraea sp. B12E4 TaxID=3153564 RepID=UPI00325DEA3D
MAYPDPRYYGDKGEINALFRPATAAPDFISTSVATGGVDGQELLQVGGQPDPGWRP